MKRNATRAGKQAEVTIALSGKEAKLLWDILADCRGSGEHQSHCAAVHGIGDCDCEGYGEYSAAKPTKQETARANLIAKIVRKLG
jgi:hypothetical protein